MSRDLPQPHAALEGARPYQAQSQPADVRRRSNEAANATTVGRYLTYAGGSRRVTIGTAHENQRFRQASSAALSP